MTILLTAEQVMVTDEIALADLKTLDDCEMALLTLSRDINRIEEQLAQHQSVDEAEGYTNQWAERAESAIRFKKAIKTAVQNRSGAIRKAQAVALSKSKDRAIIDAFRLLAPLQFEACVALAKAENPELWSGR